MRQNSWRDRFIADPPELAGGVELAVEPSDGRVRLRLRHEAAAVELSAAFLSVPYPSGLRRLLASIEDIDAVVVEHIPSGLDAAAAELGVSYLDRHGFGRVVAPGIVYVAPPPVPSRLRPLGGDLPAGQASPGELPPAPQSPGSAGRRPQRVSPFAPKASRIIRALLAEPDRSWRLSDLAKGVGVDPGNAHRILASLLELDLVERDDDEYLLPDPGSLLEAWAEAVRRPRERIVVPIADGLVESIRELVEGDPGSYAVSGELAAELLAPYLDARRALLHCLNRDAYSAVAQLESLRELKMPPVNLAGRFDAVLADERIGQFGEEREGLPLVSPQQLYVDLYRESGRTREAAEYLRRQVLKY
jgi:hypothetical protein